jgi:hypothetical protein
MMKSRFIRIPIEYYFEVEPTDFEFFYSLLKVLDLNKINNITYSNIRFLERNINTTISNKIRLAILLELGIDYKDETEAKIKDYTNEYDRFFNLLQHNLRFPLLFSKVIYC